MKPFNRARLFDFSRFLIRRRYVTMTRLQDAFVMSSCWQESHPAKIEAIRKCKVEERELRKSGERRGDTIDFFAR